MARPLASLGTLALCLLLTGTAFARPGHRGPGGPGAGGPPTEAELAVHELRHEIAVIELYNALALDDEQRAALAPIVADVVAEREAHRAERAATAATAEGLLEDYLAEVKKSGAPSPRTVAALKALRQDRRPDDGEREAMRDQREEVREQVLALLTEEQVAVLQDFRPMADVAPSPEEMAERHAERRDRVQERVGERGGDVDKAGERFDRISERRGDRRGLHMAKMLLFSPEMLELLK